MLKKVSQTVEFLKDKIDIVPRVGLILGTGFGNFANKVEIVFEINYEDIPNFPISTVKGHHGKLIFAKINQIPILILQGRFHYYEGYSMKQIAFPIIVMKKLGIELLVLSNASGGINPDFNIGDIMLITDHINLMWDNPLRGENFDELGPRFLDMSNVYDKTIINKAKKVALKNNLSVKEGVFASVMGPCFETPAEYKCFRIMGADAIGMSTIPEVISAHHMGLKVFAFSIITDLGVPGKIVEVSHEDVINIASKSEPLIAKLVLELINSI